MRHDIPEILATFSSAVIEVLSLEALRYADPGERHVVGELFVRLRERFPDWDVSNEYDRREQVRKRPSHSNPSTGELLEADITPDLIVHRIGARDNLLVVEIKRHVNSDFERDVWKLMGLTAHQGAYGYAAGVHLVLNIPKQAVEKCDVYVDGAFHEAYTISLRALLPEPR